MSQDLRQYKTENYREIKCSMCERSINKNNMFTPITCLMKYGVISHRICDKCWWDDVTGFALESSCHLCPGCQKELPLTSYKNKPSIFVDLTKE